MVVIYERQMDKHPLHRTGATGYNGTSKGTRYERSRFYPLPRSKGKEGEGEMREILFRGKRIGSNEWVYGNFVRGCLEEYAYIVEFGNKELCRNYVDVIPKTVGQYTGLTDKNGKKIFEGDIGRYKQTDGAKINGKPIICIGKVVYNEKTASFAVDSKDEIGAKNYDYFPIKKFEIIGNIHDNPELFRAPQNDEVRE